jgi:hypothetical protein
MGATVTEEVKRPSGFVVGIIAVLALVSLAAGIAYYLPVRFIDSGMVQAMRGL